MDLDELAMQLEVIANQQASDTAANVIREAADALREAATTIEQLRDDFKTAIGADLETYTQLKAQLAAVSAERDAAIQELNSNATKSGAEMTNSEIAAAVAKALGLGKQFSAKVAGIVGYWDGEIGPHKPLNVLHADGSNVFDPYWQVRCRDWLLEHGYHIDLDPLKKMGASHDIYRDDNAYLWDSDCPASEFCARAIYALTEKK